MKFAKYFIVDSIFSIIIQFMWMVIPIYLIDKIVELISKNKPYEEMFLTVLIALLLFIIIGISSIILNYYKSIARINFQAKINNTLFNKLNSIDYENHEHHAFLNKYTLAIDNSTYSLMNTYYAMINIVSSFINSFFLLSIFTRVHYIIIIYSVFVAIVYYLLKSFVVKINIQSNAAQQPNFRERGYVRRMFYLKDTIEDIKSSDVDEVLLNINDTVGNRIVKNNDIYFRKRIKWNFLCDVLIHSIFILAVILIAYQSLNQAIELSDVAMLIYAALTLSSLIRRFSQSMANLQSASAYTLYYFEIMAVKSRIENTGLDLNESFNHITLENVSFSYDALNLVNFGDLNKNNESQTAKKEAVTYSLKDINLTINKGEKIAIVGHNGAGKTTFVKLLLRLYDPQSGKIKLNSTDYKDINPNWIRQKIGAVFQNFQIYATSIAENVLLHPVNHEEDEILVYKALEFSGLKTVVDALPNGINTELTKEFESDGAVLSGGQRQKLAIARVYCQNYDLIILDEPSSALDPLAEHEIHERMLQLGDDKTLIFISHRLSTTIKADKIYLFSSGELIEQGTHKELMKIDNGIYKNMFNIQAKNYLVEVGEVNA
ncbi:MAG: transporter related [Haloplasmataceae bacterium]|nr:transporter related [Haloplasmataceae bacterium]